MKKFEGVITALITPFKNKDVDYNSLKRLIHSQLEQGIDGFVVHGTTAESPTTTDEEKEKIFHFIKSEVANQVPLIVGTGSNSTQESIHKSKKAEKWGADAVLTVVPYYNKPPQRGLFEHFSQIANSIEIPTILYNVPSRTITALELETIVALSENKKIVGIKEASGNMELGAQIAKKCRNDFVLLSGDDKTFLQLASRGGRGVIGVISHIISKPMRECYRALKTGDSQALAQYEKFYGLIDSIYLEANPIPLKYALKKLGMIDAEELRLPLTALATELRSRVDQELKAIL